MPPIRYFTVTQEREIKVSANTLADAIALADRAFRGEKAPDDQLRIRGPVVEKNIEAREEY